ncbi:hypothetical protein FOA52_012538 [Chlamydomonas sp. UWO 241]|nr:hypothetical protein FOA52_012538 [Chlamydomonas sp. UWO 241]
MKELLATSTKTDEEKAGAIMTAMFKTARGDNQAGVSLGVSQAPAARATQEQVYFDKRGEGESFGEASFFTDTPSHEAVMTCSVVRLLLVSRATFEGLLDQFPIAGRSMMEEVLHDCDERIEDELAEIDPEDRATIINTIMVINPDDRDTNVNTIMAVHADLAQPVRRQLFFVVRQKAEMNPEDRATVINTIMVMSNRRSEKADLLLSQLTPRQTARLDMLRNVKRGVQLFSDQHDDQRTAKLLSHVAKNNIHEVKTLLSQGMSPDAASHPDARTGLHIASAEGHTHMARLLLESGANPMVCDRFVRTPLLEAARNGHDDMLALLREYKASLRTDNLTTAVELCGAISNGDLMYVRRLLRAGVDPEMTVTDMRTALHIAAAEGDLRSVKVLVEEGAALIDLTDRWGQTPLDNAKAAGAHAVVAYLQPMMDTATELRAACNDQQRVASWLRAAATGDLSTINTMITQRINPDVTSRTHGGRTALMLAVEAGHEAVATRLLEYDASTATRDVSGVTALFYAARAGHDDLVMDLLAHGITLSMDPQVVSYHMCAAAADVAAGDQSVRRMRILRTAGADPLGVLITAGTSPLHVAAGANNVPAVKYLLMECGADAGGLNASGLTPRQLAQATGAADADAVLATWLGARSGPRASGSGMARMRGVSFCGSRLQSLAEVGATTTGSPSAAVARIWSKEGATGKPVPAMRPPFGSTSSDTPPLSTCDSDASHSRASAASSAPQHQQQWGTFRSVDPVTGALTSSSGAPPPPPLPFNIASAAARASPTFGARGSPSRMGGAYVGDRGRDPDFATASANSLNSPSSSTPLLGAPAAVPLLVNDSDDTSSCPSTPTNATASTPLLLAMGGGGSRIGRGGRGASLMMPSSSRPGSPAPFSGSAARATPLVPLPLPPLPLPAPAAVHVVSPLPRSSHPSAAAAAVSDSANSVQGVGGAALASALPSRSMLGSTGSAAGQDQQDGVAAAAAEAAVAAAAAGMLGAVRGGVGLEGDVDADGGADALEEQQQQGSSSSSAAPAMPAGGVAQVPPVVLAASSPTPHAAVAHVEAASSAAAAESAAADAATAGVRDALADMVHELGHVTAVSVADRDRDRWPSPVGGVAVVLADLDAMVEEIGNARSYDGRM